MRGRQPYGGAWPRVRRRVLDRDGYLCQVRGPRCTGTATQVDHIVPLEQGGAWWDEANLRAACQTCNLGRVRGEQRNRWRRGRTRITLVVGPPGADLAGYVRSHQHGDDVVVDEDRLRAALPGGAPMHGAAFAAAVDRLRRAEVPAARAWIVSRDPHAEAILPHHDVVEVGAPTLSQTATADGGAPLDADALARWQRARRAAHETTPPSRAW